MESDQIRPNQDTTGPRLARPTVTLRSGRVITHSGFLVSDRLLKTSLQLAKALDLTKPRPKREAGPMADLYAFADLDAAEQRQ
jgi:hypothetical protein